MNPGWPRLLLLLLVACAGMPGAHAGWSGNFNMQNDSGVSVGLVLAYDTFPNAGYVPCRINIQNGANAAHTWNFRFVSPRSDFNRAGSQSLERSLTVDAGKSASFEVLMPIYPKEGRYAGSFVNPFVDISGYGVEMPRLSLPNSGGSGKKATAFVAMSPALTERSWKLLQTDLDTNHNAALSGSEVDLKMLSEDWRGLLGVDGLWISTDEYAALSPGQRNAVRDWVAQGGSIFLCGSANSEVPDFGPAGGDLRPYELGNVHRRTWTSGSELPIKDTAIAIDRLPNPLGDVLLNSNEKWSFAKAVGKPSRNVAFLSIFITLFAIAVGPLNLFWFAGAGRRHRLFWTIPVISVAASLLLGVVIVLQDGFGGRGVRMTLKYLLPADKQTIVMQEQVSRTGVLLSRQFDVGEDTFLAPMTVPPSVSDGSPAREYTQNFHTYGGDWFLSRATQAQFAEQIVPSREAVEISSPSQPGEAPSALSTIPAVLDDFYYVDARGGRWRARNIRTGERVTLQPADAENPVLNSARGSGNMLARAFSTVEKRPGYFYAVAGKSPAIETLRSIRWAEERTIYLGPVTLAP